MASFTKDFTTDCAATIGDGNWSGAGRDGAPDKIAPGGSDAVPACYKIVPPMLNAHHGGGSDAENRGVIEFDISTLAGLTIESAALRCPLGGMGTPMYLDHNPLPLVSGYFGDGEVTLADFNRLDVALGQLPRDHPPFPWWRVTPAGTAFSLDVTSFLRSAIDAGEDYVGFVLHQTANSSGKTFSGVYLRIGSDTDFAVPAPLAAPSYT